jgi:hypothetical protein
MFLHHNRRITALIGVICLAQLIFCLIEREARRNLAPATKIDGLYAGRPAKPTAGLIFTALATLRLRHTHNGPPRDPRAQPHSRNESSTYPGSIPGPPPTHRTPCANYGASCSRPERRGG